MTPHDVLSSPPSGGCRSAVGSNNKPPPPNEVVVSSAVNEAEAAEAAALIRRLQAQFGDMDVTTMLNGSGASGGGGFGEIVSELPSKDEADDDYNNNNANDDEEGCAASSCASAESDSSSDVIDPDPEQLRIWQEAQYKLAQWAREGREEAGGIEAENGAGGEEGLGEGKNDDEDWVKVTGPPDLDGQESAFFVAASAATDRPDTEGGVNEEAAAADDGANGTGGLDPLLSQLAAADPSALGGKWIRLYSSNVDGLSYARLLSSLRGYDGPTVLLLGAVPSSAHSYMFEGLNNHSNHSRGSHQSESPAGVGGGGGAARKKKRAGTLGLYTATPWRESGTYYGTDRCFLFRVDERQQQQQGRQEGGDGAPQDQIHVVRPAEGVRDPRYMFCRSTTPAATAADTRIAVEHAKNKNKNATAAASNVPPGIGVGGGAAGYGPRLHVTESLEGCRALPFDGTFEPGPLLPPFFGCDNDLLAIDDDGDKSGGAGGGDGRRDSGGGGGGGSLHYFDVDVMEAWGVGGTRTIRSALKARFKDRELAEANLRRVRTVDKAQFVEHLKSEIVHSKAFAHCHQTSGRIDDESLDSAL